MKKVVENEQLRQWFLQNVVRKSSAGEFYGIEQLSLEQLKDLHSLVSGVLQENQVTV
jgi:hypothetical protein